MSLPGRRVTHFAILLSTLLFASWPLTGASAAEPFCPNGSQPDPAVLWCDDFDDGVPIQNKYFEYEDAGGRFVPVSGEGISGSVAMRATWRQGDVEAGNLKRGFGRSPVRSQSHSNQDFREIYWRQYVRMASGWTGDPYKLSRATILATGNWAQAMIAHIWGTGSNTYLILDPASGIDSAGRLVTTQYNDFANLRWLGLRAGTTPIFSSALSGVWHCVEAHVKLNTPGSADGVFEFWINGNLEARRADLNWVGTWQAYGINAVFFENYWNDGAPGLRVRYFDNIVIATKRIGCLGDLPNPPTRLRVR